MLSSQENIVTDFLESKDVETATRAIKDIKGARYAVVDNCLLDILFFFYSKWGEFWKKLITMYLLQVSIENNVSITSSLL